MVFPSFPTLTHAYEKARNLLLAERTPDGHWIGELSNSALSTATAVSALALTQKTTSVHGSFEPQVANGVRWIAEHQNADGGWGDTLRSFSNISTTMLCRAAFHITGTAPEHGGCLARADAWLAARYGRTPEQLAEAIRRRYGKDRTFSVPILMTSALAGLVSWSEVPALPFELACLPQSWYRFVHLPVVSYALPALIAIGQAVFHHRQGLGGSVALPVRLLRRAAIPRSLRVLTAIQPHSGGFLEAAPLTSFVTLGLVSSGQAAHPVVARAIEFLLRGVQPDGSWPIDTNLSVWVTTLSVNALAAAGDLASLDRIDALCRWIIDRQGLERHPYTGADPGGWGWSHLSGSVPDADDSPGALLALHNLSKVASLLDPKTQFGVSSSVRSGLRWLLNLQNRDGGWPTFCRGWGALPFDRSGVDLTAHVLRAFARWQGIMGLGDGPFRGRLIRARQRGLVYLQRGQRRDGSWVPLWFGNQHARDDENPTYGTCKVLAAFRDLDRMSLDCARQGVRWLLSIQNTDGGWGGAAGTPSSIEETALAVEVLLDAGSAAASAVNIGLAWLVQQVEAGQLDKPTPIGFYFAKLWYFEKCYPLVFTVAALGRARRKAADGEISQH